MALLAVAFLGGRCGTAVRIPVVDTIIDPTTITPDCEKRFEVESTIDVRYPATPAGAPATPVAIGVGVSRLRNVDPVRIAPDAVNVSNDSRSVSTITGTLRDACADGDFDVDVDARATNLRPTRDVSPFSEFVQVKAVGFDVTQEIVVDIVDETRGAFEADFELACCSTSVLLFDVSVENEQNIAALAFDPSVVADTRLGCPRTEPPKRYKLVGTKAEPELGASFRIRVARITPPTSDCAFRTSTVP